MANDVYFGLVGMLCLIDALCYLVLMFLNLRYFPWRAVFCATSFILSVPSGDASLLDRALTCARFLVPNSTAADSYDPMLETFSFEAEVDVDRSPQILSFYRLRDWTDADWLKVSIEHRVWISKDAIQRAGSSKDFALFQAIQGTPPFLSPKLSKDASGQIEASDNAVSLDVATVRDQLNWFWDNIGPASLHGHVAFNRYQRPVAGAENYLKFDSEISLLQTLAATYENQHKTGNPPGRILGYPYLGPMDQSVYETFKRSFSRAPIAKAFKNPKTKFFYGTTFRPDLYGDHRVGFEIRNCIGRRDCVQLKMLNLQRQIKNQFQAFRGIGPGPMVSKKHYWQTVSLYPKLWPLFYGHSLRLRAENSWFTPAAAKYAHRFTFPFLDWKNHPLIQKLDQQTRSRVLQDLDHAQHRLLLSLEKLSEDRGSGGQERLLETYRVIARWASESGLARALLQGMRTIDPQYDFLP